MADEEGRQRNPRDLQVIHLSHKTFSFSRILYSVMQFVMIHFQGLLRFAMEATRAEDAPHASAYQEMDPERRRFLEEAIRSLTIDVVEQIQTSMQILIEGHATAEEQKAALDRVTDFIENIDTANDFYKIGGFCILLPGLESPHEYVRQGTAELIGDTSSN